MKKALAMLLTLMMLLSLIPGLAAADDPVTVTAMWNAARPQNEFTEETRKYIEDTLGVNIELTQVSENRTGAGTGCIQRRRSGSDLDGLRHVCILCQGRSFL